MRVCWNGLTRHTPSFFSHDERLYPAVAGRELRFAGPQNAAFGLHQNDIRFEKRTLVISTVSRDCLSEAASRTS
jgi:hypothetical protein